MFDHSGHFEWFFKVVEHAKEAFASFVFYGATQQTTINTSARERLRVAAGGSSGGSPVPGVAVDSVRITDAPQDALPPPERIITDCAEDTLKLVWLQYHVKQVLHE